MVHQINIAVRSRIKVIKVLHEKKPHNLKQKATNCNNEHKTFPILKTRSRISHLTFCHTKNMQLFHLVNHHILKIKIYNWR